jgi:hypothetical protein
LIDLLDGELEDEDEDEELLDFAVRTNEDALLSTPRGLFVYCNTVTPTALPLDAILDKAADVTGTSLIFS